MWELRSLSATGGLSHTLEPKSLMCWINFTLDRRFACLL